MLGFFLIFQFSLLFSVIYQTELQFFLLCLYAQIDCLFLPRTFPSLSDNDWIKQGGFRPLCFFSISEQTKNGNKAYYLCLSFLHYSSFQASQMKYFLTFYIIIFELMKLWKFVKELAVSGCCSSQGSGEKPQREPMKSCCSVLGTSVLGPIFKRHSGYMLQVFRKDL